MQKTVLNGLFMIPFIAGSFTLVKVESTPSLNPNKTVNVSGTSFSAHTSRAEQTQYKVAGKCGMCKKRIEKAALSVEGVTAATWDKATKMLTIESASIKKAKQETSKAIAKAGHDTEFDKADDKTYEALPGCCHYDRTGISSAPASNTSPAKMHASQVEVAAVDSFWVNGKCGMCKKRIEKTALTVAGVTAATWNKVTKMLTIESASINKAKQETSKAVAQVGHDTEFDKADDKTYEALPGCCHYQRTGTSSASASNTSPANADVVQTASFKVAGNCNGCKKRIEKAALSVDGVATANWDKTTKSIKVGFNSKNGDVKMVSAAIAKIGHDTEYNKADNATYEALPGCCQYERM